MLWTLALSSLALVPVPFFTKIGACVCCWRCNLQLEAGLIQRQWDSTSIKLGLDILCTHMILIVAAITTNITFEQTINLLLLSFLVPTKLIIGSGKNLHTWLIFVFHTPLMCNHLHMHNHLLLMPPSHSSFLPAASLSVSTSCYLVQTCCRRIEAYCTDCTP